MSAGVLFDIDGTLCDTNYLHAVAWHRALREHGHFVPMARIHRLIGMSGGKLLKEVVGENNEAISDSYRQQFEAFHDDIGAFENAAELLRACKRKGLQVILASSAEPDMLKRLRGVIDADDAIDDATGAGDVEDGKPEPDIFAAAMKSSGLQPNNTVVVGDTVWDIKAAQKAGLQCIGVLTGGTSQAELEKAGATAIYKDAADLLQNLDTSPIAALFDRAD